MTYAEQTLADDKMRAEIAKLIAETAKLNKETFWHPIFISSGLIGAVGALAGLLGYILSSLGAK